MIKVVNECVCCADCKHSELESIELVCNEFGKVIEFTECYCSAFEKREND